MTDIKLLKLGIRCKSPALTLMYETEQKKRMRVMPIRFFNVNSAVDLEATNLKEKHSLFLKNVPNLKIEKLLHILQETERGKAVDEAVKYIQNKYRIDPDEDLNKVSEAELVQKKKIMEENFMKSQLKKGDPNYQYDVEVDFDLNDKVDAGWDSGTDEAEFWEK